MDQARRDWRRQAFDDESRLWVALLGDGRDADAHRFAYVMSLAAVAGVPLVGVVASSAQELHRTSRFIARRSSTLELVSVDAPIESILHFVDVALWVGFGVGPMDSPPRCPGSGAHAATRAVAHGLPVIAPGWAIDTPWETTARIPATRAGDAIPADIVRALLPLLLDPRSLARRHDESVAFAADRERWARSAQAYESRLCGEQADRSSEASITVPRHAQLIEPAPPAPRSNIGAAP